MDQWCPWCEWLGTPRKSARDACPECGTPLVTLPPTRVRPARREPNPVGPAAATGEPSGVLAGPPGASWETSPGEDAIRGKGTRRRRSVTAVLTAVAVGATAFVAVASRHGGRPLPQAGPVAGAGLPPVLGYLGSTFGKALEGRVFVRAGDGREAAPQTVESQRGRATLARPDRSGAAPFAVRFAWSRDGSRAWVLDARGVLHLEPGGARVGGPIAEAAFSPDGTRLALCQGSEWPLQLIVVDPDRPTEPMFPAVAGCEPTWSPSGVYLAYRIQTADGYADQAGTRPSFAVMNTRLGVSFQVPGRWPMTWAPGPLYLFTSVTAVSASGDSVIRMDERGGQRHTLISGATLRMVARGRLLAPITGLAWSLDASLIAVAFGGPPGGPGLHGVAVVSPSTGEGTFVGTGDDVVSLSWSSDSRLVAAVEGAVRRPWLMVFRGARFAYTVAGGQEASWAPDGRWILSRVDGTWFALDSTHPERRVPLGWESSQWAVARWCCPVTPVVKPSG